MSDRTIDVWQPGDGTTCNFAKRAPVGMPCGKPVATIRSVSHWGGADRPAWERKYVVCASHVPGLPAASEIARLATKAAGEQLIAEHWDAYQRYRDEHIARLTDEAFADLPEVLRDLARQTSDEAEVEP